MTPQPDKNTPSATTRRWSRLSDDALLGVRICDLGLTIKGTPLEGRIQQLYRELESKGLRFRPPCWLSSEWFSPNRTPGIAIPFYLANRRLTRLEDRLMLEVEGGDKEWCMQLLRHEAGHAYETAYRLNRRARWRSIFGAASKPYPDYYSPRPVSRRYVLHLDWWYAQSHPCEDFAETFAVWLRPRSQWRKHYVGWPALKKLEYVDELMSEIAGKTPPVRSRAWIDPVSRIRKTLREHYDDKRARYSAEYPDFFDRDLRRLFPDTAEAGRKPFAAAYLRRQGPELCKLVASWTGEHTYTVNRVLKDMIQRARELNLRVSRPEHEIKVDATILLTMQTMDFVYRSHHTIAL